MEVGAEQSLDKNNGLYNIVYEMSMIAERKYR